MHHVGAGEQRAQGASGGEDLARAGGAHRDPDHPQALVHHSAGAVVLVRRDEVDDGDVVAEEATAWASRATNAPLAGATAVGNHVVTTTMRTQGKLSAPVRSSA